MRRNLLITMSVLVFTFSLATISQATQLIWTPINPSFGGQPYNGIWMMSQAEAQKPTVARDYWWQRDPIEQFEEDLRRQMLSRLSRKIIDNAFGEDQLDPGYYEVGDYAIDIVTDSFGIHVKVADVLTGDETIVTIPYY